MNELVIFSRDGLWITLRLEKLAQRDTTRIISGGNYDFIDKNNGYILRLKAQRDANPKKIIQIVRDEGAKIIGRAPAVMGPSYASGFIDFIWDEIKLSEDELLLKITKLLEESYIGNSSTYSKESLHTICTNCNNTDIIEEDNYCNNCGVHLSNDTNEKYLSIMENSIKRTFSKDGVDVSILFEEHKPKTSNITTKMISGGNYDFINNYENIRYILQIRIFDKKIEHKKFITFIKNECKKIIGKEPVFDLRKFESYKSTGNYLNFIWYDDIDLKPEELLTAIARLIEESEIEDRLFKQCKFAEFEVPSYSICPVCNIDVKSEYNYCRNCGRKLYV